MCQSEDTEMKDLRLFTPDDHTQLSLKWDCGYLSGEVSGEGLPCTGLANAMKGKE